MPLKPALIACAKPDEAADIGHGAAVATIVQNIGHVGLAVWEALPSRVAMVRTARVTVHLAAAVAEAVEAMGGKKPQWNEASDNCLGSTKWNMLTAK